MARSAGRGPRQPLSRRKPGKAAAAGKRARPESKRSTKVGGPPPKTTIPPKTARSATNPTRRAPKKRITPTPQHAAAVWRHLSDLYPDAHCELNHHSPWELLVATILSAQCTDRRVNIVAPQLFARWPTPDALAAAPSAELEEVIRSTGFFRAKAKSLLGAAAAVTDRFGGTLPRTIAELTTLPGVGRKTANVVLGNAFGINEGIVVDTHVGRLALRLGLTAETDPVKVERDLMALFPPSQWTLLSHLLIFHGRRLCDARRPKCEACPLREICPSSLM